jgi:hypothetical protein
MHLGITCNQLGLLNRILTSIATWLYLMISMRDLWACERLQVEEGEVVVVGEVEVEAGEGALLHQLLVTPNL